MLLSHGLYPARILYPTRILYPARNLQASILEWVAISFSRGSSQPRDQTAVVCTAGRFFTDWATREACISEVVDIFPAILIPAWDSSSLAFCMTYSATWNKGLFQICKGVHPCCLLSPGLFNLCGISIMKRGKLKREASIYTQSKEVTQKELCHCPYPQLWKPDFRGLVHRVMQELKQRSPRFYKETHFIWNRLW